MNENICTWITYADWKKEIRFCVDPVEDSTWVAIISFPRLSDAEVEEVKKVTYDKVQELLAKLF